MNFEWKTNLGQMIQMGGIIVAIAVAYGNIQADIRVERESRQRLETTVLNYITEIRAAQDRNWDALERRMIAGDNEIKDILKRVDDKMDVLSNRINQLQFPPPRTVPGRG